MGHSGQWFRRAEETVNVMMMKRRELTVEV